jgi:transposase InsO family protein
MEELWAKGWTYGKNRVARLMRLNGIRPKRSRKFKVTTNSKHSLPLAPNLLNQRFIVDSPASVWVSDITYIWTDEGWLYLAGVLDLYDRQIIGWSVSNRINEQLTFDALGKAIMRRSPDEGLIHHSDQGRQYAAGQYRKLLKKNNITQSMSRKGNCYDNAVMESFFKTLKVELIYRYRFRTREEAKKRLFDYIEIYYNRQRRHSALGYLPPAEFAELGKAS